MLQLHVETMPSHQRLFKPYTPQQISLNKALKYYYCAFFGEFCNSFAHSAYKPTENVAWNIHVKYALPCAGYGFISCDTRAAGGHKIHLALNKNTSRSLINGGFYFEI